MNLPALVYCLPVPTIYSRVPVCEPTSIGLLSVCLEGRDGEADHEAVLCAGEVREVILLLYCYISETLCKTSSSYLCTVRTSVADPDPHVFGPPGSGSGSISQRYGSGSIIKQK